MPAYAGSRFLDAYVGLGPWDPFGGSAGGPFGSHFGSLLFEVLWDQFWDPFLIVWNPFGSILGPGTHLGGALAYFGLFCPIQAYVGLLFANFDIFFAYVGLC